MPTYLNHRAIMTCVHGGTVKLIPPPMRSFWIMGSPVVTDMDLMKAFIIFCPQVGPGLKPCTKIVQILLGRSINFKVDGETPILDTLRAVTDGSLPGIVSAIFDGVSNAVTLMPSIQMATFSAAAQSGAALCPT